MSVQPAILCSCGRRIEGREVLQQGYFMSQWKPLWVFVKYRCSRCRMLGEKLVAYEAWDAAILGREAIEARPAQLPAPAPLGEIHDREIEHFSQALRTLRPTDIDRLAGTLQPDTPES